MKTSILSKIENLSYEGLLKWELAYKNKIKGIESYLNIEKFRRKTEELKKLEKTIPTTRHLIDEISKHQSNFYAKEVYFIKKTNFFSRDEGFCYKQIFCMNETIMNPILEKIQNFFKEWSQVDSIGDYFSTVRHQIKIDFDELEIKKTTIGSAKYSDNRYVSEVYSTRVDKTITSRVFDYFYPLENDSISSCLHNVQDKEDTGVPPDFEICEKNQLKGIDYNTSILLVGNFFQKLQKLTTNNYYFPASFPEEDLIDRRSIILEKANYHLRKIQLKIRSKKRSIELGTNLNFVYIMSSQDLPEGSYKIGFTTMLPEERAEDLSGTSVLHDYKVEYSKKFKNAEKVEKQVHEHFSKFRIKKNKEVFSLKLEKIIEYIESIK